MKNKLRNLVLIIKILVICPLVFSCQINDETYEIKEDFKGPCIVFIYDDDSLYNRDVIKIDSDGFGRTNKKGKSGAMSFRFQGDNSKLSVVDMPYLDTTKSDCFAVYGFGVINDSPDCMMVKRIRYVEFFIGTKTEFISWQKEYKDIIEYFDKKGIDWCKYYKGT